MLNLKKIVMLTAFTFMAGACSEAEQNAVVDKQVDRQKERVNQKIKAARAVGEDTCFGKVPEDQEIQCILEKAKAAQESSEQKK